VVLLTSYRTEAGFELVYSLKKGQKAFALGKKKQKNDNQASNSQINIAVLQQIYRHNNSLGFIS
jgi:hypothetical protein